MQLTEAFTDALTGSPDPPPAPIDHASPEAFGAVLDFGGGTPAAAARSLGAIAPRQRLPAAGTPARTRYEADKRSLQRYRKWADDAPGERRTPTTQTLETLRRRLITSRRDPLIEKIRRCGARARLYARVFDDTPTAGRQARTRERELPAGGPGQYLPPADMRTVTDLFLDSELDEAADSFLDLFLDTYGFPEADIDEIHTIKIWADGDPEPR